MECAAESRPQFIPQLCVLKREIFEVICDSPKRLDLQYGINYYLYI